MKIVLKKDFVMSLNLRKMNFKKGDIIEADEQLVEILNGNGGAYDIIEGDDVLTDKELKDVIVIEDLEQSEDEAIEAEAERSIVEDEQSEAEALEAEELRVEMEDVPKPKSKRKRK